MPMNRGEVWWVERPEGKRRPFLILTRDRALAVVNEVIAVPATRVPRGLAIEVPLGPEDGMRRSACCRSTISTSSPASTSASASRA